MSARTAAQPPAPSGEPEAARRDYFERLRSQRAFLYIVATALALAGVRAAFALGTGIYPEVEFPRIVVVARLADVTPETMQATVAQPLEQPLATVLGVERIRSRIIRGAAEIDLRFADGLDMELSLQRVQVAIGQVRDALPAGTELEAERVSPADFPVVSFQLEGRDSHTRRETAEFVIAPALARVPGVGRVEVNGGDPHELEVVLDPTRTAALGLAPREAARRVEEALVRSSVGRAEEDRTSTTMVAENVIGGVQDVGRIAVARAANGPIPLAMIADVREGEPDRALTVHAPGGDAVEITVSRAPQASAPVVVRGVREVLGGLTLPAGLRATQVYDQGVLIQDSVIGIRDAIALGIGLTVGVLAFFLRGARTGIVASLAVPWTLAVSFLAIGAARQTLNLMTLGGLAVAIGLVIDDAIVVVEAVVRHMERGAPPEAATRTALAEMRGPVIGTTVTTVVVFLPLAFLPGLVGRFFWALAVTLSSAVLLSLAYALVVLPLLTARWLRAEPARRHRNRFATRYARGLDATFDRSKTVLVGLVLASLAGLALARRLPSGFLPEMDEGGFVIDYALPAGTSLAATEAAALGIESILAAVPDVATWTRRTGAELGPVTATLTNTGDVTVLLKPKRERRPAEDVEDDVRRQVEAALPGVQIEFVQVLEDVLNDLSGNPRPIEIKIAGADPKALRNTAAEVAARVEPTPGLVDFAPGIELEVPIARFDVGGAPTARADRSPRELADDLATAAAGTVAGTVPYRDRLIPVRVRFPDAIRRSVEALARAPVACGRRVLSFGELAPVSTSPGASVLRRENGSPVILASGDLGDRDLGSVARDVEARLRDLRAPAGVRVELGGQVRSQTRAFRDLAWVLALGLAAVFAVLVAQLRSVRAALVVLTSVPPALLGGVVALAVTGVPLNVSSLIGLVLLVGLVVKNGILLVDAALGRIRRGAPLRVALRFGARRRLRPILMTTLCTVFGLMPLAWAFGAGSELQRPLAIAVLGGLALSTATTLLVVPALAHLALSRPAE